LAQNTRGIAGSPYAVNANRLIELSIPGTTGADRVNAGTAGMTGTWLRRATDCKHAYAAIGGVGDITEPRHAGEVPAATSLHAVGIAGPGLPVNTSRISGAGIWAAAANTSHSLGVRATTPAKYPGAVSLRVAEARYTQEIPSAKALHAVGVARAGLADNTRTPRAALAENADRRTSACGRSIDANVLAATLRGPHRVEERGSGDPDNTASTAPTAPSDDTHSFEIAPGEDGVHIGSRLAIRWRPLSRNPEYRLGGVTPSSSCDNGRFFADYVRCFRCQIE